MIEQAGIRPAAMVRRVLAGRGMVTPTKPTRVTLPDGSSETLLPGQSRLSPSHEWVKARPELFTLCDTSDARTREELRQLLKMAIRSSERTITRRKRTRPSANWLGTPSVKGRRWL